ncbi:RPA-interacting protein [Xylocopa sonorina]|uniref:RPA-interacting protein n=1 Tax=Xylocopa sonorina TaxID=1818115 RepID=UPI00403AEA05
MWKCTKDMENVSLSPTMTSKLKTRNSVNKIRHGSPKLQEVLRERCRTRMRERREQLFNRGRFGLKVNTLGVQGALSDIVREELLEFVNTNKDPAVNPFYSITNEPLELEEALELEAEIVNEEEQWILREYERISEEEIEMLTSIADHQDDQVICPVCKISNLIDEEGTIGCKSCKFKIKADISLLELGCLINNSVDLHSAECKETPAFLPLVEDGRLFLFIVCRSCSTLNPVI